MSPGFKPPKPPQAPDERAVSRSSETLERSLIFGILRSYWFYLEIRDTICPYDANTQTYRQDFSVERYNTLYEAIDAYWRSFADDATIGARETDFVAANDGVMAYVIDWTNARKVDKKICQDLQAELESEKALYEGITLESSRALARSAGFKKWLENRVIEIAFRKMEKTQRAGKLTMDELKNQVSSIQTNAGYRPSWVNAGTLMRGNRIKLPAFPCSIKTLNAVIGGGFRRGEAWVAAAMTNCGKTIFANQLAWDFATLKANVVVVTTEQKPDILIPRLVSSVLSVPFSDFLDAATDNVADIEKTTTTPIIPETLWLTKATDLANIERICTERIRYVDWTGGNKRRIEDSLDSEIRNIEKESGLETDVVIFDWLGGALVSTDDPKQIRMIFKEGADFFARYCHTRNILGILTAQLNVTMAMNKKVVNVHMLGEAKNIAQDFDGFAGISGVYEREEDVNEYSKAKPKLLPIQYIHISKTRTGPGGVCPVRQEFQFQRFKDIIRNTGITAGLGENV